MYTLYGKKGSGSASTQAALEIIGAPYRIVETASWDTNDAFAELLKVNPLGQIPTLVLADGSVLSESAAILIHLGGAHPDSRPAAARRLRPRAGDPRPRVHRGQLLRGDQHHRLSGALVRRRRRRRRREGAHPRRHARAAAPALGDVRRSLSGAPVSRRQRNSARSISSPPSCRSGRGRASICKKARPAFYATLLRIEAHPKVAPVFAQHWPTE